jgi:8-oxo-dGTP pyrophosphatase MutT (NUDIX family)
MAQKYRIYINEKVILLTESKPSHAESYEQIDERIFDLRIAYNWVLNHHSKLFYVLCSDAKACLKAVIKSMMLIKAAGGLVINENNDYLFIYRNNKWDIPKGKIEEGEGVKEAAVREVEEECGIKVSSLEERICKTYHTYLYKGEVVLKKTYWFKMRCKGQPKLKPQKEEGITEVRWFKKGHIEPILHNTFPSITDVLLKEGLIKDKAKLPLE